LREGGSRYLFQDTQEREFRGKDQRGRKWGAKSYHPGEHDHKVKVRRYRKMGARKRASPQFATDKDDAEA